MQYKVGDIVGVSNSPTLQYKVLDVYDDWLDVQHSVSGEKYYKQAQRIFTLIKRPKPTNAERMAKRRKELCLK